MRLLKANTSVTIRVGPFLDKDDGVTEETGLSLAATDVQVSKGNGAFANKNSTTAPVHGQNGWYSCVLDATDTNTLGNLIVKIDDSATFLPVWHELYVVQASVYDALLFLSYFQVNVKEVSDDAAAANNLESDYDGTGYSKTNSTIGTVTSYTGSEPKKNTAISNYPIVMRDEKGDPVTAAVTVTISKDGAAFGASTNSASHIANGVHKIDITAAEMNANIVVIRATASGAKDTLILHHTQE